MIARGEGGGQTNMTERAYGAEPSRAERVVHGERNAAEGCIDPPAARSRRRRAPRRSNPLAVLSLRRATPNPKRLPRFASREKTPLVLSLSLFFFLSVSLAEAFRFILLFHPSLTCLAYTPATPSAAHVDHAARGDISEPG